MNPLEARRRILGRNVYKRTTEGNPAIAQGSLARRYPGITMQGWTTQDGTPTPETPVPIVSAGTQNQETGKWEYEITIANAQTDPDKNQTVTLTSDRPLTKWDKLEKRNGQWGWVYKSSEIVLDGSEDERWSEYAENDGYYTAISASVYNDFSVEGYAFSDKFLFVNTFSYEHPSIISPSKYYYFLNVKRYGETLSDWRTYLQMNPVTILYETELETFVTLSESEQEAMNELYTFRPTTVLSNDCDCNMILTYKTKKSLEVTT